MAEFMTWNSVYERNRRLCSPPTCFLSTMIPSIFPCRCKVIEMQVFETVVFCNHINFYTLLGLLFARQRPNPHCSTPML